MDLTLTRETPAGATQPEAAAEMLMRGVVEALSDKKGLHPVVMDISHITTVARYFVLVTGTSTTHIRALADAVEERADKMGLSPFRRSGYAAARWILLDYSDVVVHVFHEEERAFYGLERLWQDAEFLPVPSEGGTY